MKTTLLSVLINATIIFFAGTIAAFAQETGEVIQIKTSASQIGLTIPQNYDGSQQIEVLNNGVPATDLKVEKPGDSPVHLYILISFDAGSRLKFSPDYLLEELKNITKNTGAELVSLKIVTDTEKLFKKVKLPKNWKREYVDNLPEAVRSTSAQLKTSVQPRKALLVLTNSVQSLPVNVIEQVDTELASESALVYLMNINELPRKIDRQNLPVVSRTNINGIKIIINREVYLATMFRSFIGLINSYHKVSFQLPEDQENETRHKVEIFVRDQKGTLLARNDRLINYPPKAAGQSSGKLQPATANSETATVLPAATIARPEYPVNQITNFAPIGISSEEWKRIGNSDALKLPPAVLEELLKRVPELTQGRPILDKETAHLRSEVKQLLTSLQTNIPVFVYDSEKVEARGMNGFVVAITSKTLKKIKNREILNAIIAHEIAHAYFAEEFQIASRARNFERMREIELKCDLAAVKMLAQAGIDTKAYLKSLKKMARLLPPDADVTTHPNLSARLKIVNDYAKSNLLASTGKR